MQTIVCLLTLNQKAVAMKLATAFWFWGNRNNPTDENLHRFSVKLKIAALRAALNYAHKIEISPQKAKAFSVGSYFCGRDI
ncbi:hypothetical protein KJ068_08090 [bacterium]|nr:hypothetical protein [bacterium]